MDLFQKTYVSTFSSNILNEPLEIVTWKVEALGPEAKLADGFTMEAGSVTSKNPKCARKGTRKAYFDNDYHDCPVYERSLLEPNMKITGPALIEERESTSVIGLGDVALVDTRQNLIAELVSE